MKLNRWLVVIAALFLFTILACRKRSGTGVVDRDPDPPGRIDSIQKPTDSIPGDSVVNPDISSYSLTARHLDLIENSGGFYDALPKGYDSNSNTYPLLVFLHGGGEVGDGKDDLDLLLINGLAKRVADGNFPSNFVSGDSTFSFVMIFPQFKVWPNPDDVQAVIDYALKNYRINSKRIYLAGMSMGGGTTWNYAALHGKRLAAMVTICGASLGNSATSKQIAETNTPVWSFHNQGDNVVNVGYTTSNIAMILAVKPDYPYRMTIWPSGEHDAWTEATDPEYREEGKNMYEWILQYSR